MSKKWKIFLIIFILLNIPALPLISPEIGLKGRSHSFEGRCRKCHLHEPKPGDSPLLVRTVDQLCKDCHKAAGTDLSHPSGVKPSFPLPVDMKLDWSGKMTCVTCHRVHGTGRHLVAGGKSGRAFCTRCHREPPAKAKRGQGIATASVHQPRYEIKHFNESLDQESIGCLSCHDGTFSRYQHVTVGSGIWNHTEGTGLSHPIGSDYGNASRKGGYKPVRELNKNIRLFNGKLGCGSCHNQYSMIAKKLVVNNDRRSLCLECHTE